MARLFCLIIAWAVIFSTASLFGSEPLLKIANWSEYMDDTVLKDFETKFGCRVEYTEYAESEDMMNRIIFTPKAWDVIITDGATIAHLVNGEKLARLRKDLIPNSGLVLPQYRSSDNNPDMAYAVPYLFGSTGIIYRKDLIKEKIRSWKSVFEPQERLRGKIILIKDRREVFGAALKNLGYSVNSNSREELQAATRSILQIKPYLLKITDDLQYVKKSLVSGDAWLAVMYSSDSLTWISEYPDTLRYIIPDEGAVIWGDGMTILKKSTNSVLAHHFINFILEPQNGARLSNTLHAAAPSQAVRKYLKKTVLNNPGIYPTPDIQEKLEMMTSVSILKEYNKAWRKILK